MKLFKLDDKGKLIKVEKIDFDSKEIYVVDEQDLLNVWIGCETTLIRRKAMDKLKNNIEKKRGNEIKILLMEENKEYGSFLAIMDDLKQGNTTPRILEERTELKLEKPKEDRWMEHIEKYRECSPDKQEFIQKRADEQFSNCGTIKKNISKELKAKVSIIAYYISQEKYEYSELCWMLAERLMRQQPRATIEEIRLKSEQIFKSSITYDEVCWLIAQMDVLGKEKYIKDTKISFL